MISLNHKYNYVSPHSKKKKCEEWLNQHHQGQNWLTVVPTKKKIYICNIYKCMYAHIYIHTYLSHIYTYEHIQSTVYIYISLLCKITWVALFS